MNIKVSCVASEDSKTITITLGDLGLTQGEWVALSENDKLDLIKQEVDNLPEHPYWCVDKFIES